MARPQKTTNKNNIIILCEGSDTEVKYFKSIKEYLNINNPDLFSEFKIIPVVEERINVGNNRRPRRKLQPSQKVGSTKSYWEKIEESDEEYNKYKAQPTRYVREAQLFMEEDGFVEAWAVYDKDTFTDHKNALDLAASVNVHVAYSSYCFEEWILLHFERNITPFSHSVCKVDGKDKGCGTNVADDCHGSRCLAGYIREHKYIPDYAKSKEDLFTIYTLPNFDKVLLNAAWVRSLSDKPPYECNPYTNVDCLVKRLLGFEKEYIWCEKDTEVPFAGTKIYVTCCGAILSIINATTRSVVFKPTNCFIYNHDLSHKRPFVSDTIVSDYIDGEVSTEDMYLCLMDSNKCYFWEIGG